MRQTAITYTDGRPVSLGDVIEISVSATATARGRIVMIGDTGEHLEIDRSFLDWVTRDKVLEPSQVVVEWLDSNPLPHNDPSHAPVGNYMFTQVDCCVIRIDA
jgi:hypothetical protein